jgi:hypothetical protein
MMEMVAVDFAMPLMQVTLTVRFLVIDIRRGQ